MSIPNLVSRYPLSVDRWVAPCQAPGQGRPAHRHARAATPRLARPTAPARPCPRAHASYVATDGRVGLWHGWILVAAGMGHGPVRGGWHEHRPMRGTGHRAGLRWVPPAPALARLRPRAHTPPHTPAYAPSRLHARASVTPCARECGCVCPRAPGEGARANVTPVGDQAGPPRNSHRTFADAENPSPPEIRTQFFSAPVFGSGRRPRPAPIPCYLHRHVPALSGPTAPHTPPFAPLGHNRVLPCL
jgi:hypothetical protein